VKEAASIKYTFTFKEKQHLLQHISFKETEQETEPGVYLSGLDVENVAYGNIFEGDYVTDINGKEAPKSLKAFNDTINISEYPLSLTFQYQKGTVDENLEVNNSKTPRHKFWFTVEEIEEDANVIRVAMSPCKDFKKYGCCKKGMDCWFKHGNRLPTDADKIIPLGKRQSCKYFARCGWCGHGKDCRHKHGNRLPQEGDENQPIRPRQECGFFARNGHCKHGSNCKHLHGGRDPRPEDGTDNQKKQRRNQRRRR
jgi:hypothetical protein